MIPFTIEPASEGALLLRFGDRIDPATNAAVRAAARAIRAANLDAVTDVAPAYASLLVRFDPAAWAPQSGERVHARISTAVRAALRGIDGRASTPVAASVGTGDASGIPRVIDIPVCYGGAFGPDLAAVAAHAGITPDAVIARHVAPTYTVAMLGFAPGFPYLLGLDPALRTPRRTDPRIRVPRGSVAIGGAQTGIYPRILPGGWQLLGCTPLDLFDPARDPPALLAPGDEVRFHAIDEAAFERIRAEEQQRGGIAAAGSD